MNPNQISSQGCSNGRAGFTLIELSIVLVIIGLIAGGILVGQDMIKAAEIRSTAKQIQMYNAAINTFRDKYRYIPGDISRTPASNFGFVVRAGTVGQGDGNGLLEAGASGATFIGFETGLIWRDLNQAGLLDGSFVTAADALPAALNADTVKTYLPEARMGRGNLITAYSALGTNFYQIGGVTAVAATGAPTLTSAMTPQEAYNLDQKTDDASPLTGSSRAMVGTVASSATAFNTAAAAAAPAVGVCVSNAAGTPYNTSLDSYANTPSCALRMRFN